MSKQEQALAEEILADARKRAERATKRARREADRIVSEAEKQAEAEQEQAMEDARERVERMQRVADARIEQDVAALRRTVHQGVVRAARQQALRRLRELTESEAYCDVLLDLAIEAVESMSGHDFYLVLRPEDREAYGADLPTEVVREAHARLGRIVHVKLAEEPLEAIGGIAVRDADGHQVADQSFESRLQRLWDDLRHAVAVRLPDELMKEDND
jgi:vacuolar-type H+-ATPase subunit E/Vma4